MRTVFKKLWKSVEERIGTYPETIVDIGVGRGTPFLYETFPDAHYLFIDPLVEYQETIAGLLETYSGEHIQVAVGASNEQATYR